MLAVCVDAEPVEQEVIVQHSGGPLLDQKKKVPRKCLCVWENQFSILLDSHRRELVPVVGDQDEPCPHRGEDFPGEVLRHPRADKDDVSVFRLPSLRGPLPDLLVREEAALARLVVDDVGEGPEKNPFD